MSESNQRQDTNIRDIREVLGHVGKVHLTLQAAYGTNDPALEEFEPRVQEQIREALALSARTIMRSRFEVKTSSAGVNREVERQSFMTMLGVLNQYGQTAIQLGTQLANQQLNPILRLIMNDTVRMMRWMAVRLLRTFDVWEAEGVLPDVSRAVGAVIPGGGQGTPEEGSMGAGMSGAEQGGVAATPFPIQRAGLESMAQVFGSLQGALGGQGMGPA